MIQTEPRRMTTSQIYKESGIMYIRYDGEIETQSNGQQKIGGSRPAFNNMEKQVEYRRGRIYSLLMGREFKPNQYAILLDLTTRRKGTVRADWHWLKSWTWTSITHQSNTRHLVDCTTYSMLKESKPHE